MQKNTLEATEQTSPYVSWVSYITCSLFTNPFQGEYTYFGSFKCISIYALRLSVSL